MGRIKQQNQNTFNALRNKTEHKNTSECNQNQNEVLTTRF